MSPHHIASVFSAVSICRIIIIMILTLHTALCYDSWRKTLNKCKIKSTESSSRARQKYGSTVKQPIYYINAADTHTKGPYFCMHMCRRKFTARI